MKRRVNTTFAPTFILCHHDANPALIDAPHDIDGVAIVVFDVAVIVLFDDNNLDEC